MSIVIALTERNFNDHATFLITYRVGYLFSHNVKQEKERKQNDVFSNFFSRSVYVFILL